MTTPDTTQQPTRRQHWLRPLSSFVPNRDFYSWFVLFLIVAGEAFALGGLRTQNWHFWGWGTLIAVAVATALFIIGRFAHHSFSIRSVIVTKLLANAIAPQLLGTLYLLAFVIHIGWLTNAAMSLFTPLNNLCEVLIAIATCVAGMVALICFFPVGVTLKDKHPSKVFVTGISYTSVPKSGKYDELNLVPLVRILQHVKPDDKPCRMIVLMSTAFKDNDTAQNEILRDVMQLVNPEKTDDIDRCKNVRQRLDMLIRAVATREFGGNWTKEQLRIEFTKSCDYNTDFKGCFDALNERVNALDDENHVLYFNCTPGTSTIGALMTLLAIDGDRQLCYYSQETMPADLLAEEKEMFKQDLLRPIDKSKIPLYNLLSQALDKFEKNK